MNARIQKLEMRGIVKRFPGVLSNDHVNIEVSAGEVLALLGENGAGKTTLMNILYGLYQADAGEILINGEPVQIDSPRMAIDCGIGMVASPVASANATVPESAPKATPFDIRVWLSPPMMIAQSSTVMSFSTLWITSVIE